MIIFNVTLVLTLNCTLHTNYQTFRDTFRIGKFPWKVSNLGMWNAEKSFPLANGKQKVESLNQFWKVYYPETIQ